MSFKLSSQKLDKTFTEIASRFRGKKPGAKLTVSEEASWWYYHEFGTATHDQEGDFPVPPSVQVQDDNGEGTGSSYDILPRNANGIRLPITPEFPKALIFPAIGQGFTMEHPGVPALGLVRTVLEDIHETAAREVAQAIRESEYSADGVQDALENEVMPAAKELIVESIAEKMGHHTRIDPLSPGKLNGQSPSDVFSGSATISPLEE